MIKYNDHSGMLELVPKKENDIVIATKSFNSEIIYVICYVCLSYN